MKKHILFLQIIVLIFLNIFDVLAQKSEISYLDSVFITIDDRIEVKIGTYDIKNLEGELIWDINSFQNVLKKDLDLLPDFESYTIRYVPNESLTVKEFNSTKKIILMNGKPKKFIFTKECQFKGSDYTMILRYSNPEDILSDSIKSLIKETIDDLPVENRWAGNYNYSVNNNKLSHLQDLDHPNGKQDYLSLNIGMGANLVKNQPTTDISAGATFQFNKKGIEKNEFYLSDNLMFLFDENQNIKYNNFINLGYKHNLSKNANKNKWAGFELGYLTNRSGNFFDKNTMRIGLTSNLSEIIILSTLIYVENGKKVYPGIRIGFIF